MGSAGSGTPVLFETLGNASVLFTRGGTPLLATDPWLVGTCYFGSWALDHPLTQEQIAAMVGAEYIWISHGHPDHLHDESLALLKPGTKILLPDHYCPEISVHLRERGFNVTILRYREWFEIAPGVRVLCIDNANQDAVLAVEADGALVLNINDSPLCGELRFLRSLVRSYPRDRTYLLALCSIDADMFNIVDAAGSSLAGPPDERKRGAIWGVARTADLLGVGSFCCSSSQHIYVCADSIWANPYRIGWQDMARHWSRQNIRLIEPFVTVDLATGTYVRNHPSQQSDESQISAATADDDWDAKPTAEDWAKIEAFFRQFELVRKHIDFVEVEIGGDRRRIDLNAGVPADRARGIVFMAPLASFMTTVTYGYMDDMLIGNFMRVRLVNITLYPRFTPLVAKVGGNAKVYTRAEYRRFRHHYWRRNPIGFSVYLWQIEWDHVVMPWLRSLSERLGIKAPLKYLYRTLRGDPVLRSERT